MWNHTTVFMSWFSVYSRVLKALLPFVPATKLSFGRGKDLFLLRDPDPRSQPTIPTHDFDPRSGRI